MLLPRVAPDQSSSTARASGHNGATPQTADSLFERVAWVYAFCRERLFRDDTDRIVSALWPKQKPKLGARVIELGCGPGFYSRKLAQRYPNIHVTGVDRSERQLSWARQRVEASSIHNCSFERVNVLALPFADGSFDALIASRIFTILPEQRRAVEEMFRVLKTGGRCFIAEPRDAAWASIPLFSMWLLASVIPSNNGYREPKRAKVFSDRAFEGLFNALPWKAVQIWRDGQYQYALCEKG
jgi:arsenite methyltransferase